MHSKLCSAICQYELYKLKLVAKHVWLHDLLYALLEYFNPNDWDEHFVCQNEGTTGIVVHG